MSLFKKKSKIEIEPIYNADGLRMLVDEIGLEPRIAKHLARCGIKYVDVLCSKTEVEVANIPYMGRQCAKDIKEKLIENGFDFKHE